MTGHSSKAQPLTVDATFYAVVEPRWDGFWVDDQDRPMLLGAKVDRITQARPQTVRNGAVVTRLTLRLDAAALLPLAPEAIIAIHPGMVEVIEAVAENPASESEVDG